MCISCASPWFLYWLKPLLAFHSITECDQTSFANRCKKTAWAVWVYEEVTPTLQPLCSSQSQKVEKDVMPQIERLSVGLLMYDKASECSTVFVARKDLLTRVHSTHLCFIDPTCEAVSIPSRISVGTIFCGISCSAMSGWLGLGLRLETWEPGWTLLPSASEICQDLLKCGCNPEKDCWGLCWCVHANMLCTALRKCGGECDCDMFCVPVWKE